MEFQSFQINLNPPQIIITIFRVLLLVNQCPEIYIRDILKLSIQLLLFYNLQDQILGLIFSDLIL